MQMQSRSNEIANQVIRRAVVTGVVHLSAIDRADTSFVASVDGVGVEKAVAIGDHLLNAAKNHPPGDSPLDIRTEHDERERRLRRRLNGSLSATSHLLFLVNLHLTQSRT